MQKSNYLKSAHKHTFVFVIIAGIICLWSFVVYPKIAFGVNAPPRVTATAGDAEVLLEWTDPNEGELSPEVITGYRIYYFAGKFGEQTVDTGDTEFSYTVTGLENGTEYIFEVTTLTDGSESERSRSVTATPEESGQDPITIQREPTASATNNTATISWTTSIEGTSVVEYGPTSDFKGEISAGAAKTTDHSIEITGLTSCAGYWFKVLSYDDNSNLAESQEGEFKTIGCKGESSIISYEASRATSLAGTTVTIANSGRSIEVIAPPNMKSGLDAVAIEAIKLEKELVRNEISVPVAKQWIGNAYSLKAFEDERTEINDSFDAPVEVTINYTNEDVVGIDISTLTIYHYEDGSGWRALSNCSVNQSDKTVTCETTSFSIFGLFGSEQSSGGEVTSSGSYPKEIINNVNKTEIKTEITSVAADPVVTQIETNLENNFQKNLRFGQRDLDVKKLQQFLNKSGFVVAVYGPGSLGKETDYFGPLTFAALIKFQEAHRNEILAPYGLVSGTGYFGMKTREYINSL